MQDPGKYLVGIGLVAEGPHFQEAMVLPPSVVPTNAVVPVWIGVNEIALAVPVVSPPSAVSLPTTLITPLAVTVPEATYFVTVNEHAPGNNALTSTCVEA